MFDTYDYYKVKANCLKERGLIKMIVLSSNLLMKNQRQWMYSISDKDFTIKTGFIFVGMLVLIGLTCYATLNWN